MRYTVRKSVVQVIGKIWMPSVTAAQVHELSALEVNHVRDGYGKITRESVQRYLDMHARDFASVDDFYASIEDGDETVEIEWEHEESELTYNGCMFPDED
jgi:hypothetical protein